MVKVAGVRFKTAGKVYYFDPGELKVSAGDPCHSRDCQRNGIRYCDYGYN